MNKEQSLFFSRPDIYAQTTQWSSEMPGNYAAANILNFEQLSDEEKDTVADAIEQQKAAIGAILAKNNEFQKIYNDFFLVPSLKDIKVIRTSQQLVPVLTQWGCKSSEASSSGDPLSVVIQRPRANTSRVLIEIKYTDETIAANKEFGIEYLGRESREITDEKGKYDRGRCKNGSLLKVYDIVNNKRGCEMHFTVAEGTSYKVEFPLMTTGTLHAADQKGVTLLSAELVIGYDNKESVISTGESGVYSLAAIEVGKTITVKDKKNPDNEQVFTVAAEGNDFVFTIRQAVFSGGTLRVMDDNDELVLHYPVLVEINGKQKEYNTGATGVAQLDKMEAGRPVKIIDKNKIDNYIDTIVQEEENNFVLRIKKTVPKFVRVRLLDKKSRPMPSIPIDFSYNNNNRKEITDKDAYCILPYETFADGKKVNAAIHLPATGRKKEKMVSKSFMFKQDKLDYILKLKRRNWWWFLLLLLPLLLLIKLDKDIVVKTVDKTGKPVPNVKVHFSYVRSFAYDSGRFLTNDTLHFDGITGTDGTTVFKEVQYSVFSWVFHHSSKTTFSVVSDCYTNGGEIKKFHAISSGSIVILQLDPLMVPLDFKTIDKDDGQELPGANVNVAYEMDGNQYKADTLSDPAGRVVFNVAKCFTALKVVATAEGYYPDSIIVKKIDDITGAVDSARLLKLKPVIKPIEFFVVDCRAREIGIPGANVKIEFKLPGKNIPPKNVITNINGVGKIAGQGNDTVRLNATIHLSGTKQFYKPGELTSDHKVREFIDTVKYPRQKRTFCLDPLDNPVTFIDVDQCDGKRLKGVKNIIHITHGSDVTDTVVYSNANGEFTIAGPVDSKVSIIAQYPPDYEDDNTKVKDADLIQLKNGPQEGRTIPLKGKEVELLFRTVEAGSPQTLVPQADLRITIDCNPQPVFTTNSGNGEFTVHVPIASHLSIVASKPGYQPNGWKINGTFVKNLLGKQEDRDIPLKKEPPKPCREVQTPQKTGDESMEFDMQNPNAKFIIHYNMYGIADRIIVRCGRKGSNGTVLFDRTSLYRDDSPIINLSGCGSTWVTVEIIASPDGSNKKTDSNWDFRFECIN